MQRVAVVAVSFNAVDHVGAMIESVRSGNPHEPPPIIVVDNGSTDGTVALLRGLPDVQLIEQTNRGYASGVNRGVAAAPDGHDILVLNPDLRVRAGAIRLLGEALDAAPDIAIAVPALQDDRGHVQASLRREPTWWRTLVETLVGGTRAGRLGESYRPHQEGLQRADWATGAALLVRRDVLDELGPWDESYFLYSEETEFCLRARDAGYRLVCQPRAIAEHVGGDMARNPLLWALRAVNQVRLERRRRGCVAAAIFRSTAILFELRRVLTGDAVSRAALWALTTRDLEATAIRLTTALGGDPAGMASPLIRGR